MQFNYAAAQWLFIFGAIASLVNSHQQIQKRDLATSNPFYPSPWMSPDADCWKEAYAQAKQFVSQMTLLEKVNLTTGVG